MLLIALAAIVGTTMTVWAIHFMQTGAKPASTVARQFPSMAVLPFQSLSTSLEDIQADQKLTNQVVERLAPVAHVEALVSQLDADPVAIGRETGVKTVLIGKVERRGARLRLILQLISAHDGKQVWTGSFDGNSGDLKRLAAQVEDAVTPHLTSLLD